MDKKTTRTLPRECYLLLILLLIGFTMCLGNPKFLTFGNLQNIILNNFEIGMICVTMTFVILMGGMDMSVGSVVGLCGMLVGVLMANCGMHPVPAILCALLAAAAVGALNGGMVIAFPNSNPMIITIGSMVLIRAVCRLLTEGWPVNGFPLSFSYLSYSTVAGVNCVVFCLFITMLGGQWFLQRTVMGMSLYAIGNNERGAYFAGVRVRRIKLIMYILSALMAGLAGVFLTSRMQTGYPDAGDNYHMDAIAAIVIGGTDIAGGEGSMMGTLLGFFIISVLKNGLALMGVSSLDQMVFTGVVLIFTIWLNRWQKKRHQQKMQKTQMQ